jgi:hypothetical protein
MLIFDSRQKNGQHSSRTKKDLIFRPPHFEKRKEELPTLNFLTRFLSDPLFALCRPRSCGRQRANAPRKTKTRAKKFSTAPASWTDICLLIVLFSVDTYAQIQTPQTPQSGTFQPITSGQNYPQNNNGNNQRIIPQQQNSNQRQQINDLHNILHEDDRKHAINYSFPSLSSVQGSSAFYKVYKMVDSMLTGLKPMNLKKAVFTVEHAYDNTLVYEKFNKQIKYVADVCRQKVLKDGIMPDNREGVNMIIYQVLCDSIDVQNPKTKVAYKSYPYLYDFTDFRGEQDIKQMFVSKLLRTHKGNCHSMPLLYLIIAEELKTDAYLTFAPEHSFIRFQDNKGNWINVELTNGRLTSDAWVTGSGFVKSEALINKIYLDTIDKKQTIAINLFDLGKEYLAKIGMDEFILKCAERSLYVCPNHIFSILQKADYWTALSMYIANQKGKPSKEQIQQDPKAWASFQETYKMYDIIDNSGYVDMPKEEYEQWRKSK